MSCCPGHNDHQNHNMAGHTMAGPNAAQDFLQRFLVVTALLVPLFIFRDQPYLELLIATVIFYFAGVFFSHARHELSMGKPGMMTLVSLAVGAGFLFSAASTFIPALSGTQFYLEISTLIWVLLFGHYLEAKSSSAAGDALSEVAKLLPRTAHLLVGKTTQDVDVATLKANDLVLIKPGEKIPSDGTILEGTAHLDESLISGESKPVTKNKGDTLVAGSICLDGSLTVKLTRVGEDSTVGRIQKLIATASQTKPSAQKLADKAANLLTITAVAVAIATVVVWVGLLNSPLAFALTLAITVLVIACPHALGLAIPTVSTIATQLAVKNGLFIKDMAKLEVAKNAKYVLFDKTGTLTSGQFGLVEIKSPAKLESKKVLSLSASLESRSSHVIGLAIVAAAKKENAPLSKVTDFRNFAGRGVSGKIGGQEFFLGNAALLKEKEIPRPTSFERGTVVYLADNKKVLATLTLADQIKPESKKAVADLHSLGVSVALLTGDSEDVAREVAAALSIDKYFARVLPEEKYQYVRKLQENHDKVLMVGDGVNDAPALTQADVGVAVGAGTELAVEAGDVVLTRSNPADIVALLVLSRKVFSKMTQNLFWAAGYNIITIPLAAGVLAPWGIFLRPEAGAILMSLSSVIVVINALTLRGAKLRNE